MKEIRQIFAVRDGSVLLQTLVICMVLSYIAVTLTQWILARYTSSSSLSDTMELSSMGYDAPSHDFSAVLSSCFSGNQSDCADTDFSNSYSVESYIVYGGIDPGPCWEGEGNKHWTAYSTAVNTGNNTKTQRVVFTLYLPYDNSAQVNSCLGIIDT